METLGIQMYLPLTLVCDVAWHINYMGLFHLCTKLQKDHSKTQEGCYTGTVTGTGAQHVYCEP